ncbi:MAG: hypothetical protein JJT99_09175 [Rhodobacteraceae bacterium]|nr:hypothetical protein [Paracoccaceae bacterium]
MRVIIASCVATGMAAMAQAEPQITAVTLSTAGLALISATAPMDADGLSMTVRRADIDDFLKSLRLSDPAGGVPVLTMTGPGGLADTFAALPFGPEAVTDLRALIDAMPGAPAQVERRGTALEGRIMGSRDVPCTIEGQAGCAALTLRLADGTLRQIALDEATSLRFADAADNAALERALRALRAGTSGQMVPLRLSGSIAEPREIALGWLQPAPVWKTAWRAETTAQGVELTGWAVLENTTGQDWRDIELTLATGAVQALQVQLYDRLEAPRKLAEPMIEPEMLAAAPMARSAAFEAAFDIATPQMEDTTSFSRFTLPQAVTLQAGEMISLPFLRDTLRDAWLTVYRGGQGQMHPVHAIEIINPLPLRLPAGVMTLYQDGHGHAGDAMIPELPPNAREMVEFARDTAIRVREHSEDAQTVLRARVVDGVLLAQTRLERRTSYRIEGAADGPRVLTLAHPHRAGWQIETEGGADLLAETRFALMLEEGRIKTFPVLETRITETRIALLDLDDAALDIWMQRISDDDTIALLARLQELRRAQSQTRREIARLQDQEAELIADQDRLAGLIVQLGDDSPATAQRRARVDAIDTQIEDNRAARREASDQLDRLEDALHDLIRSAAP